MYLQISISFIQLQFAWIGPGGCYFSEQEIQMDNLSKLDSNFSNLFKASCNGISIVEWSVALSELWTSFFRIYQKSQWDWDWIQPGGADLNQLSIFQTSNSLSAFCQRRPADAERSTVYQLWPPIWPWNSTCLNWNSTCFASKRMMVIVLEILMMTSGRINIWSSAIHIVLMIQQVWRGSKVWAHSQLHHHKQVKSLALQSELRRKWDRFYTFNFKGGSYKSEITIF